MLTSLRCKAQIAEMAKGATFQGVNLLNATGADQDVVTGYTAGTGVSTMTVTAYNLEGALTGATTSVAVGTAIDAMKAAAAALGSAKTRIDYPAVFHRQSDGRHRSRCWPARRC